MPNDVNEQICQKIDLDSICTYLSGAIDYTNDGGKGWRDEWTCRLIEIGFNRKNIINPLRKPLINSPLKFDNESEIQKQLRKEKNWSKLDNVLSKIVRVDLRSVDKADLILVNMSNIGLQKFNDRIQEFDENFRCIFKILENNNIREYTKELKQMQLLFSQLLFEFSQTKIPTYGTTQEIVVARQQQKQVYIVWEGGKELCSSWLMWLVGHENIFDTFDELLIHLRDTASGKIPHNPKDWLVFDLK